MPCSNRELVACLTSVVHQAGDKSGRQRWEKSALDVDGYFTVWGSITVRPATVSLLSCFIESITALISACVSMA